MMMMNTWGDRAKDSHVSEAFILRELMAANRLGTDHFQIDDGWQSGRSANSAFKGGSLTRIWSNPDYWQPDPKKFPHGLTPVMEISKKLNIEVCLWFNPSQDSSYAHWSDDAGALNLNNTPVSPRVAFFKPVVRCWHSTHIETDFKGIKIRQGFPEITFKGKQVATYKVTL